MYQNQAEKSLGFPLLCIRFNHVDTWWNHETFYDVYASTLSSKMIVVRALYIIQSNHTLEDM